METLVRQHLAMMRELRDDLPDGMWEEAQEIIADLKDSKASREPIDWDDTADWVNQICEDWGLPGIERDA